MQAEGNAAGGSNANPVREMRDLARFVDLVNRRLDQVFDRPWGKDGEGPEQARKL